jgi:hypothetical protein
MLHCRWFLLIALVSSTFAHPSLAADWPMWRYDEGRSAVSPQKLPETLQLHWVRELPEPQPAWPASQTKL